MPYPKIKCGCLGCGKTFKAYKDGRRALEPAIEHMANCCPEKLDDYYPGGTNFLQRCWIGCKNCEVPGYVHETRNQRKRKKNIRAEEASRSLGGFFAMRNQLVERMTNVDNENAYHDEDYDYDYDDEESYDDTEVDFLRPDGDFETKDVQWCLDNDFLRINDGLWSGKWYYEFHPNEKHLQQNHLRQTNAVRERNERRKSVRARGNNQLNDATDDELDNAFLDMLRRDNARMMYGRQICDAREFNHGNTKRMKPTQMSAEMIDSRLSSVALNPSARVFTPAVPITCAVKTEVHSQILCKKCKICLLNKDFPCILCKVKLYCGFGSLLEHLNEHKQEYKGLGFLWLAVSLGIRYTCILMALKTLVYPHLRDSVIPYIKGTTPTAYCRQTSDENINPT